MFPLPLRTREVRIVVGRMGWLASMLLALPALAQEAPVLRARFVDEQGRPLAGVAVQHLGLAAPVMSDESGQVRVPMRGTTGKITATLAGRRHVVWRPAIPNLDVGEVVLGPEAVLSGRIVGADGSMLGGDWRVAVSAPPQQDGTGQFLRDVSIDPGSGEFRIDGLPSGQVTLIARHLDPFHATAPLVFTVEAGTERFVEVPIAGPDPSRYVRVALDLPPNVGLPVEVMLVDADGVLRIQRAPARGICRADFVGLGRPPYRLTVQDPRFEPFERAGVSLLESVRGRLVGSSTLQFLVDEISARQLAGAILLLSGNGSASRLTWPAQGRLQLPSGSARVGIELVDGRSLILDGLTLEPGVTTTLPLVLRPAVWMTIRAVDDQGRPVEGVVIAPARASLGSGDVIEGPAPTPGRTDAAGRVVLGPVSPGLRMRVDVGKGQLVLGTREIVTASGQIDVPLPPHATLELVPAFPVGSSPALRAFGVRLRHTGDDGRVQESERIRLVDSALRVIVPPGRCELRIVYLVDDVSAPGGELVVAPYETRRHEIDLRSLFQTWPTVKVRVDGATQRPQQFRVFTGGESPEPMNLFSEDGHPIAEAHAGENTIRVVGANGTWACEHSFEALPFNQRLVEVEVRRVWRTVTFRRADGRPVLGGRVRFSRTFQGLELRGHLQLNADGRAVVPLSAGPVTFRAAGCAPLEVDWSEELDPEFVLSFEED